MKTIILLALAQVFGPGQAQPQLPQLALGQRIHMFRTDGQRPAVAFSCFTPVSSTSCVGLWPHIGEGEKWDAWSMMLKLVEDGTKSDRLPGTRVRLEIRTNDLGYAAGVFAVFQTHNGDRALNLLLPAPDVMYGAPRAETLKKIEMFAVSGVWSGVR